MRPVRDTFRDILSRKALDDEDEVYRREHDDDNRHHHDHDDGDRHIDDDGHDEHDAEANADADDDGGRGGVAAPRSYVARSATGG